MEKSREQDKKIFATGADVAKLAGVSTITVSRVFNPAWSGKVKSETVERVKEAAKALHYQPNGIARSLAYQKTGIIAVVIGRTTSLFYSEFVMRFVHEAQARGYQTLVYAHDSYNDIKSVLGKVLQQRVDAVVITSSMLRTDISEEFEVSRIPVILFKRSVSNTNLSGIWCDEQEGARQVARYLLKQGRTRFGVISNPSGGTRRGEAFIDELRKHNIEPRGTADGDYTYESGRDAARIILRDKTIDAIFCIEDTMAIGALDVARYEFGKEIGKEIAIAGFDNNYAASLPAYDITTVAHPLKKMIAELFESIDYLVDHIGARVTRCFDMELIKRSSTQP